MKFRENIFKFKWKSVLILCILCWATLRWLVPVPAFNNNYSTVLNASEGQLLTARIADDGQWRFPEIDSIPHRFETCLLQFEDRAFYYHPGVDPKAILRALIVDIRAGRYKQGGSTITMQLARMLGQDHPRSLTYKLLELGQAIHLEICLSKDEILKQYVSHAPFGGNVVGIEAAAWRYYGRSAWNLSWAESATLAVLPNAPGLIYPGREQKSLLAKRNRLLHSLQSDGLITDEDLQLALLEPLPQRPQAMPGQAQHLMDRYLQKHKGQRIASTIDARLQSKSQQLLNEHVKGLQSIEVYNGAMLIMDTQSQELLAYVGNANYSREHANLVDCASAQRSSGSILKPFLYAQMINQGLLTPRQLIVDIPSQFAEYSPENYDGDYDGLVPADEALYRSLNIPFVRLLQVYGVPHFKADLGHMGLSTVSRSASEYGLSLMLGGAEVRLDELARVYAQMGQALSDESIDYPVSRWALHHTFKPLQKLTRPVAREYQRSFTSSRRIAWKTGTSYGHKDAWAIGVTPDYTVAVWMGNADGEGRTGLTGVGSAAPLLFDALDLLPSGDWFPVPMEPGYLVSLCARSGRIAGRFCPETSEVELPAPDYGEVGNCPYHELLYVTADGTKQGRKGCAEGQKLLPEVYFTLAPVQAYYYGQKHLNYKPAPDWLPTCTVIEGNMEFIYPQAGKKVYVPRVLDGQRSSVICKLVHRRFDQSVFWYLDDDYLGETTGPHNMNIKCSIGYHRLLATDAAGEELSLEFEVLSEID